MMPPRSKAPRCIAPACLALGCFAPPVLAAEWSVAPSVGWAADQDSNRTLTSAAQDSASVSATLDLELARRGERGEFKLRPHVRLQRFSDDVSEDSDDRGVSLRAVRAFERSQLVISAEYANENTLTSTLADEGVVEADARRRRADASLLWDAQQSENTRFTLSTAQSNVDYSGARADRLFDYRYSTASARETFAFSPRVAFFVTGIASLLENPERDSRSHEHGANVGVSYALSARTSLNANLGRSWRSAEDVRTQGETYEVSLQHQQELRDWSVRVSRSLVPYGTGVLAERESASVTLRQPLREQLDAGFEATLVRNNDAGLGATLDRRRYNRAEASLAWQPWRTFILRGALRYTDATLLFEAGEARGLNFGLSALWRPDPRVLGH